MKRNLYHLISLGCSKNLVDSEVFAGITECYGYQYTDEIDKADLIIINTCGFINDAKEEAIQTILDSSMWKENGKCRKLVVTGCLVKRYKSELEQLIPEVDDWIDLKDFTGFETLFPEVLECDVPRKILTPSHYAYLRISDGCNNWCSYCAIPAIRGKLTSEPIEVLVEEAKRLAGKGVRELILTAQDTTRYGEDLYGESHLSELLEALHEIEDIRWIRLLYLHPNRITEKLIDTIAALPKVCRYFEIPIQHISNTILKSMNRGNTKENITTTLDMIRSRIPDAVLRTTLLVGFPGETVKHYEELKQFIIEQRFGRLGVFTYSAEEGTAAAKKSHSVSHKIAQERKDELMQIQQEISSAFLASFVGRKLDVMIDGKSDLPEYKWIGRTYFDAPEIDGKVYLEQGSFKPGDIVKVKIIDNWEYDLIGIKK
ncbi:MAG TPA: 30S ribosomal protein S12 methylthiotransferase RimO [Candidatus Cloacimonadota bacterium]|nr:30S ribosomal protein S12 methylthiotransferase RimO [Candidatus Cloacimonadota bacterium]HPT72000.1 30S ribosomal protein S12 methylthiotransferase RimO [Candidatus Cloacimonadota bacterium]